MQDGDLDDTDEDSKPIIKVKKDATSDLVVEPNVKSEDPLIAKEDKLSGIQVVSTNGSAKHNNNSDKESSEPKFTKVSSWQKVQACTLKTFNRMKRRIGFLIYQFVLPAIQVIFMAFCCEIYFEKCFVLGVIVLLGHRSRSQRTANCHCQR